MYFKELWGAGGIRDRYLEKQMEEKKLNNVQKKGTIIDSSSGNDVYMTKII